MATIQSSTCLDLFSSLLVAVIGAVADNQDQAQQAQLAIEAKPLALYLTISHPSSSDDLVISLRQDQLMVSLIEHSSISNTGPSGATLAQIHITQRAIDQSFTATVTSFNGSAMAQAFPLFQAIFRSLDQPLGGILLQAVQDHVSNQELCLQQLLTNWPS